MPAKTCTWNCVYCYLGGSQPVVERRVWVSRREVLEAVGEALRRSRVDYVTFIGVGEPTLAANIGELVEAVKAEYGVRVAVLSNGGLYHRGVYEEIAEADYVKATLTTLDERIWRLIHEPAAPNTLEEHLEGIVEAGRALRGRLHIEVMLVRGLNDDPDAAWSIAGFLRGVQPASIAVNAPRSPPRLTWVEAPAPDAILEYASIIASVVDAPVDPIALRPPRPPRLDPRRPADSLVEVASTHALSLREAIEALREAGVEDPEGLIEELLEEGRLRARRVAGETFLLAA